MIYGLYHSPGETVGSMGDILKELKLPFKDVHLYDGDGLPRHTSDLEGLIIMGGPMSVDDIHEYPFLLPEVELIEKTLSLNKPVLGICLGAQLMAKALDARVYANRVKEVGWHGIELTKAASSDPLFSVFPSPMAVFHWHEDTFDLPKNAVHLARSSRCENQAFRWGNNAYGLQFHLEVTPAMIQDWCSQPDGQSYIASAGESVQKILQETPAGWRLCRPPASQLFTVYFKTAFSNLILVS